jgi:hypothetical protein
MTDTRRRVTLGQALRREESDSSIAAEIYVPRYNGNDEIEEVSFENQADIKMELRETLKGYVDENQAINNPYHANNFYVPNRKNYATRTISSKALNEIDSKSFKNSMLSPLESGQGTNEGSNFFFDQSEIESFKQNLLEKVLKDANVFNSSDPFFVATAPNENESFPQGIFSVTKSGAAVEKPYGRYNKQERVSINKDDLRSAASMLLKESRNKYSFENKNFFMSYPTLDNLRIAKFVAEAKSSVRDLRFDGNGNIYKIGKRENDSKSTNEPASFGVGNSPESGLNESEFDLFEIEEFNEFIQMGTVAVVYQAAVLTLISTVALGALIYPLLVSTSFIDGSPIVKSILKTFTPPALIRLRNELGLAGDELNITDLKSQNFLASAGEGFKKLYDRLQKGFRALFGLYDGSSSTAEVIAGFLFPSKVAQSPHYYYGLARLVLREWQDVGNDPYALLSKASKEPSNCFLLRLTATMYKLGVAVERSSIRYQGRNVSNFEPVYSINTNDENFAEPYPYNDFAQKRHFLFSSNFDKPNFYNPISLRNFNYFHLNKQSAFLENESYSFNPYKDEDENSKPYKLSLPDVQIIEEAINADYVPFSIQDLRNNEVIALPAFIDSISDSFAPNYEATHGYGRTDPVYTYARTERSIEISFNLVSFSSQDQVRMYEIVNKLVSMCYPQRSRGQKRIDDSQRTFYQPFSQIQTASPMIRLRLGDLFASNRTERGFKQLFGNLLGGKTVDLEKRNQDLNEQNERIQKKYPEYLAEYSAIQAFKNTYNEVKEYNYSQSFEPAIRCFLPYDFLLQKSQGVQEVIPAGTTVFIKAFDASRQNFIAIAEKLDTYEPSLDDYLNEVSFENLDSIGLAPSEFFVSNVDIEIDEAYYIEKFNGTQELYKSNKNTIASNQEKIDLINNLIINFLNAETNPIVRSFESTKGSGLACFIKSLSFDYNNTPWNVNTIQADEKAFGQFKRQDEEIRKHKPGVRPTRVKVSMGLTPIHDMPLGMSYDGTLLSNSH